MTEGRLDDSQDTIVMHVFHVLILSGRLLTKVKDKPKI